MGNTNQIKEYYLSLGIKESVYNFCDSIEKKLHDRFREIDTIAEQNQIKVLISINVLLIILKSKRIKASLIVYSKTPRSNA